ncbi:eukaryotic translation initiation factor 3 subunit D, putative, partial [Hepatocystis sp. ex Piliocolobus tephrosceles]
MSNFKLLGVINNRTWGPDIKNEELVNCCMSEIGKYQFEPSMKFERIGKICDFTVNTYQKNQKDAHKNVTDKNNLHDDDSQFQTVDLRNVQKHKSGFYDKKKMYNKQQTTQAFTKKQKEEDILYSSKIKTAEQK